MISRRLHLQPGCFSPRERKGLSLLEAIIAIGIFIGAMAMIGQLLNSGLRMIDIGERDTMALLRCESKMEEIVAGIVPINAEMPKEPIPDREDPRWRSRVIVEPTSVEGLVKVTVTVGYRRRPRRKRKLLKRIRSISNR